MCSVLYCTEFHCISLVLCSVLLTKHVSFVSCLLCWVGMFCLFIMLVLCPIVLSWSGVALCFVLLKGERRKR